MVNPTGTADVCLLQVDPHQKCILCFIYFFKYLEKFFLKEKVLEMQMLGKYLVCVQTHHGVFLIIYGKEENLV